MGNWRELFVNNIAGIYFLCRSVWDRILQQMFKNNPVLTLAHETRLGIYLIFEIGMVFE